MTDTSKIFGISIAIAIVTAKILPKSNNLLFLRCALNNNRQHWGDNMPSQSNEVTLIRIPGGINAQAILMALHGRGIPARTHGEIVGEIYGLTFDGLGEVSILVPEEYLEEAQSVLAAAEQGDLLLGDNDAVDGAEPDNDK